MEITKTKGSCVIGLYSPKYDVNIGGVARAISCYGANSLLIQGRGFKKYNSDTTRPERNIPIFQVENLIENIPYGHIPIAVEIKEDSKDIRKFCHPKQAYYIFGPEDGSVPTSIIEKCKYKIFIPTKYCMNLAATVNVVLYDRLLKMS